MDKMDENTEEFTAEEKTALDQMMQAEEHTPETQAAEDAGEAQETKAEHTPETQAEETGEGKETPEFKSSRQDTVPHQAMHAERMRRQEAEAKLAALEQRLAALESPPEPEPQYIDPIEDPEGHRKWAEHQANKTTQTLEQFQQRQQFEAMQRARQNDAATQEIQFREKHPDYDQAAQFLLDQHKASLAEQGLYGQALDFRIAKDVNALYDAARTAGMSVAELVYLRAQSAGYKQQQKQPDEAQKMEALAKAQKQTQGISTGGGGGAAAGKMTAEMLASMSEAELANVSDEDFAAALGG